MKSLVGKAIEFYSCFISYSSKDDDFAKKAACRPTGPEYPLLVCARRLEDRRQIPQRALTRPSWSRELLLVLSENSVKSAWVDKEVETAFEKERLRGQQACPLPRFGLDDAVTQTDQLGPLTSAAPVISVTLHPLERPRRLPASLPLAAARLEGGYWTRKRISGQE